jgi:hypothetical protein
MPSDPAFICSFGKDATSNVSRVYFSHLLQKNINTRKCNCRSDLPYSHSIHLIRRKINSVSFVSQYNEPTARIRP